MRLFEITQFTQSPKDVDDALFVWRGYNNGTLIDENGRVEDAISALTRPHSVVSIPIEDILIHQDWGRRVSGDNLSTPIIVFAHPSGKYVVLDGQHRILSLKQQGIATVTASIVNVAWRKSYKRRHSQIYTVDE